MAEVRACVVQAVVGEDDQRGASRELGEALEHVPGRLDIVGDGGRRVGGRASVGQVQRHNPGSEAKSSDHGSGGEPAGGPPPHAPR